MVDMMYECCTLSGALVDDYNYYVSESIRILCRLNNKTGQVEYLDDPSNFSFQNWRATASCVRLKDKIVFLEYFVKDIIIYDISTRCVQMIKMNVKDKIGDIKNIYSCGDKIFIVGSNNSGIIYDIKYNQSLIIDFNVIDKDNCIFSDHDYIYVFPCNGQRYLRITKADKKVSIIDLPVRINSCVSASYSNNRIIYITSIGELCVLENGNIIRKVLTTDGVVHHKIIIQFPNRCYILPTDGKDIFIWDSVTNQLIAYDDYPREYRCYNKKYAKYYSYTEDDEYYYFIPHGTNFFLRISKKSQQLEWVKLILPKEEEKIKFMLKYRNKNLYESRNSSLDLLLEKL